MLTVETFGLYGLIIGVIAIMQAFISSGIRVTLQRHLAILFEKSETFEFFKLLRKSLLVFCIISMVLGLFLYSDLGRLNSETYVKIQPYLLNIFIISCLTAFVYILADVFRCIRQVNKFIFFREFTVAILFLLLIIVLWFLDFVSLDWVLFVFSLALVGSIIWGVYSFRNLDLKQLNLKNKKNVKRIFSNKKLIYFWLSAEALGLIWVVREKVSLLYVSEYMTAADLAILFVMLRASFPLYLIKYSFNSVISPIIATSFHEKEAQQLNEKYQNVTVLQFLFIFPVLVILSTFGSELMHLLLGDKYQIDPLVLSLLLWFISLSIIMGPTGVALQMCGKPNAESFFNILSLLIIIPTNIFLIEKYGLLGLVIGIYGVIAFIDLLKYIYMRSIFSITAFSRVLTVKICFLMLALVLVNIFQPYSQGINLLIVLSLFTFLFYQTFFSLIYSQIFFEKKA